MHSSILAWKIPWTEEPGGPQSMGDKESGMTEQLTLSLSLGQMLSGSWSNDGLQSLITPDDTLGETVDGEKLIHESLITDCSGNGQ